jgi:predicted DNA-binding transcriptional regulator AlpA
MTVRDELPERLIDDRELAKRWGWSPDTPTTLRARQKMPIPFIQLGRRVRYRLSDVIAYETRQTVIHPTAAASPQ